ncbi:MAG: molecular chaperone HtpG, partial [Clostridiales bacterium]|nr:molecular chaperone HtpG [Clostridiales bacterium]
YQKGAKGVHWQSDGESTYTIGESNKETRGTKIVMHLFDEEKEFLEERTIRALLKKYCSFMPYNIYLNPKTELKKDEKNEPVNNPEPLYLRDPKVCTDEEYKKFYRDTFADYNDPLFQIHLNMEYPFRLKGILYFPKVKKQVELERGQVKLYCNQVFIADNIKEVIPEYLMLLNGVIDCPDIPLNVSRSFLQNDTQVQKIAKHISKKVADKLTELYRNDRERYEKCWGDLENFIKFGCLKDESFYDKMKDIVIYKNLAGEYRPLVSYFGEEISEEDAKNGKEAQPAYYVSDENKQAQYIKMFKDAGLDAILCDTYIDPHFISFIEYKNPTKVRFLRIDAEVDKALKDEGGRDEEIEKIFEEVLKEKNVKVSSERLKNASVPAIVNVSEFMRRMSEMNRFYQMGEMPADVTLIVNVASPAVAAIKGAKKNRKEAILQVYYLALLAYRQLTPEELAEFTENQTKLIENYVKL